ncbi:hypothetical protein K438DRAFT_1907864 [Mycena galopus ATCC 62051]|nr:hypothetical protein K438DRAFT_1907864 [Mycena galopus ATCC 62051]
MVNSHGHNGHENGTLPENLREILQQFATNSTPLQEHCDILRQQHNYDIKKTKLKNLNREHGIGLARRPPPEHICTTLIANQMAENVTVTNGPNTIQKRIALQDHLPLARQALRMGRASINMYGSRCHGSGYIVDMAVVPNTRCPFTIGHLYLDLVESTGEMPVQITVDGGTETQYIFQFHEQLRAQFLPDVSSTEVPACVALKSSDNIPIEALWSYFLKYTGHDLKAAILVGKTENYINVANEVHMDLFHWLWSRIVQNAVNHFVQYWNTHKTRKQSNKYLPSGVAPQTVFQHPENFGLRHAGIPVNLTVSREDCLRWVPLEFDLHATAAYEFLGSPELTISTGWTIDRRLLEIL